MNATLLDSNTFPAFEVYTARDLERIPQLERLPRQVRFDMQVVSTVLPFRVNRYVVEHLIDWDAVPDDPIYQLTFPQRGMLADEHYETIATLLERGAEKAQLEEAVKRIRQALNPHPAGQIELNIPRDDSGEPIWGLQHKYPETVLFFPAQGQTCHSYCTFCFRWAQFVGDKTLRIATSQARQLTEYLRRHPEVTDVLFTGGDPMVMKTTHLAAYLEPLLEPEFAHIRSIRIGTKALTFWPFRFLDPDEGDALMRLFERVLAAGKHLAIMAHLNHWRELEPEATQRAIARLRGIGATLRGQAPLIRHINDDPDVWAKLWQKEVELGIVPYYMFVERDTGAKQHFAVPLVRCWTIYRDAASRVSGLARTVRGPSMSASPGKAEILGVSTVAGERVFVLRFLQARDPQWTYRPFFARYDENATWLDELEPAFGEREWFWSAAYRSMTERPAPAVEPVN
ncbi:KamA family radical SAM protein [Tepidiphilus olei]|uniref:KamA family radical SAM protein n=1 Tax=Tepidiphilus olei TaxID=2502184 RepID=UPI00115F6B69|nr:lysine 2,3-aminomutase [Tepidiphilus olei]